MNNELFSADKLSTIKAALSEGIVLFTYTKAKDGSKRIAIGTNVHDIVELLREPVVPRFTNRPKRKPNPEVTVYFDLARMGVRSFCNENLEDILYVSMEPLDTTYIALAIARSFTDFTDADRENTERKLSMLLANKCIPSNLRLVKEDLEDNVEPSTDSVDLVVDFSKRFVHHDHNLEWCKRYNGGRGLNGVMLAAGGLCSSGYDCFGTPIAATHKTCGGNSPIVTGNGNSVSFEHSTTKAEPKAEPNVEVVLETKAVKEIIDNAISKSQTQPTSLVKGTLEFYRLELIKALLTGEVCNNVAVAPNTQEEVINAAFEMADKVIARLKAE